MHYFLSRISKNDFFVAWFAQKTKIIKRSSFRQKLWTNPFDLLDVFQSLIFWSKKLSFLQENIKKRYFLNWFAKKTHMIKSSIFWQKTWTPPFAKSGFFVLFENLIFLVYKAFYFYAEDKKRSFWLDLPKKHT